MIQPIARQPDRENTLTAEPTQKLQDMLGTTATVSAELRTLGRKEGLHSERFRDRVEDLFPQVEAIISYFSVPWNRGSLQAHAARKLLVLSGCTDIIDALADPTEQTFGPAEWAVFFDECHIDYIRDVLDRGFRMEGFLLPLLSIEPRQEGLEQIVIDAAAKSKTGRLAVLDLPPHQNFTGKALQAALWRKIALDAGPNIQEVLAARLIHQDPAAALVAAWFAGLSDMAGMYRYKDSLCSTFLDIISSQHGQYRILNVCPDLEQFIDDPRHVLEFLRRPH